MSYFRFFPNFVGSGSPEGHVVANVGQSYFDDVNGALYTKASGAATNTGWVQLGGVNVLTNAFTPDAPGVSYSPAHAGGTGLFVLGDGETSGVLISDLEGFAGTGNGLYWRNDAGDGTQHLDVLAGSAGQFEWNFNADGSTVIASSPTVSAPPYVLGAMYFDTTLNKLRIGGAAGWETVTSV